MPARVRSAKARVDSAVGASAMGSPAAHVAQAAAGRAKRHTNTARRTAAAARPRLAQTKKESCIIHGVAARGADYDAGIMLARRRGWPYIKWVMARAVVRHAVALVAALVVAAPLVFGPAFAWALHAMGGEAEHLCACGMKQGTCGCPECERLTAQKQAEKKDAAIPYRTFKRACSDDDDTTIPVSPLPPAVPSVLAAAPPKTPVLFTAIAPAAAVVSRDRAAPPPPPPRTA
jgi:hypothetical protein